MNLPPLEYRRDQPHHGGPPACNPSCSNRPNWLRPTPPNWFRELTWHNLPADNKAGVSLCGSVLPGGEFLHELGQGGPALLECIHFLWFLFKLFIQALDRPQRHAA